MTHEAGIETAFELHQTALAHAMECFKILRLDPDVEAYRALERTIQAYLSASGMALVPRKMTPEMVKNAQMHSELGAYVTSNWAGAYDVMEEYWAKILAKAPDPFGSKP